MNSKELLWIIKNQYEFLRIPYNYNIFKRIIMNSKKQITWIPKDS